MRTPSTPGDAAGAGRGVRGGVPSSPAQFLDALKRGFAARLLPLLADAQAAVEAELRKRMVDEQASDQLGDLFTNLTLLRRDASLTNAWQERIGDHFAIGRAHRESRAQRCLRAGVRRRTAGAVIGQR